MCTAIALQSLQKENFFGRTMDFSYPIQPGLYIMPKHYQWKSLNTNKIYTNTYSFISIGQQENDILGFFDGVNERGFAAAVLYFEGYADYDLPLEDKEPIAALDFLHYMLGRCGSIADLEKELKNIRIVGVPDPVTERAAPLHWMATDRSGQCVVVEQTKTGLEVIHNPIGVMANSPDFRWHMTNLRNYVGASTTQPKEVQWGDVLLTPFSQGAGTTPLPGGYTSPERFARTSFIKSHVPVPKDRSESIMTCFHIMNSVSIPKGVVVTARGTDDFTKYTAFINTHSCEYYFKTYENDQIIKAKLWDYPLHQTQPIFLGPIIHPFIA